jgi:hypothetical protein
VTFNMSELVVQPALQQAGRPLSLIPVGLKEAALDSPTFRATAVHFSDQVEIIERWLESYIRSTSKLVHDVSSLEESINTFLARSVPPSNISEAVLDHDYTLLAMNKFGDGSREFWSQLLSVAKKMDTTLVDPIKSFMTGELRNFKDARRYLEQSQKTFDNTITRYLGQSKTKEPSALREDAFQVHEARKAYLKASLDFCLLAPQLRSTVDKLLVKISADQWKEMKKSRDIVGTAITKNSTDIERIRGWSKELESGEAIFRRELQVARREIAEAASVASRPSRELEDYNVSTVAYLGSQGPTSVNVQPENTSGIERSEKQGWLYLRTISGKPARTFWVRRWFYVKTGIFGWLVQGAQSGGVEESEKIGVLLCNVKPAVQEDRRFCFEVKTKNTTILVQAETQAQLQEWLEAFELAKSKALEASANDALLPGSVDPAFAITPPLVPEFAAKSNEGEELGGGGFDRTSTLPVPGSDGALASRNSVDVGSGVRRSVTSREEGESSRDHASRLMSKLDLSRKSTSGNMEGGPSPAGGIASLIASSHNILPVYTPTIFGQMPSKPGAMSLPIKDTPSSTLAPSTLANPPAPTNLSKTAVIIGGERGVGIGRSDATGGMPSGIMANLWGSSNWGYINRLESEETKSSTYETIPALGTPGIPSNKMVQTGSDENLRFDNGSSLQIAPSVSISTDPVAAQTPTTPLHRKAMSVDAEATRSQLQNAPKPEVFPANYPLELKTQEAQFRMLFPNVPREDKLVLVFRATWNPNDQQEFPGRVYVTSKDIYFYSHHLGLVLITGVTLVSIDEVTAAPGKDCDFLFLHLKDSASQNGFTRITIKTFLEPLRLLQHRLNFLVDNVDTDPALTLESLIAELIRMENDDPLRSPSMESWEDISVNTPIDDGTLGGRRKERDLRAAIHVERGLHIGRTGKEVTKFQLPSQPVTYEVTDMHRKAVDKQFNISPKSLFHVMFGDKSAVFQLLYHERRAQRIAQGPWVHLDQGHMRRDFHFQIDYVDMLRRHRQANVIDYQLIDVLNDHICYVVTDMKTPWHLPHHEDFMLVSKIVITHVAKSKCRLQIWTKVEWSKAPTFSKGLVERQALDDLGLDALDLADVISDQVRKLGPQSRTNKAIHIFGHVGQQTSVSLFSATDSSNSKRPQIKQRTLTSMFSEVTSSFAESAASSLMMWAFAAVKTIWSISSANSLILSLLVLSVMTNVFLSGKDTSDWWTERNAAKFMTRLGVGPNLMMSKAVYLKDLDDALTSVPTEILGLSESRWLV